MECLILKNGKCYFDILYYLQEKDPYKPDLEINGTIISVEADIEYSERLYIVIENDGWKKI